MSYKLRPIKSALGPIGPAVEGQAALALAQAIAEEVVLVGVAPISDGASLSGGAGAARQIRQRLLAATGPCVRFKSTVIVSGTPWKDLQTVISRERPELLIVEWREGKACCGLPTDDVLSSSLCNVALVRGADSIQTDRALIAIRGGPHGELAFEVGMALRSLQLDVLHLSLKGAADDAPFKGLKHVLRQIPDANLSSITTDDAARTIFDTSCSYDVVVVGATAGKRTAASSIGPVASKLLRESPATVVVVKTRRAISESGLDETSGAQAISILVDKWFAENTFQSDEFSDLKQLVDLKERQGLAVSLALPALNEEDTVGEVIRTIKTSLMDDMPLLDEIVLIDSNSTDGTRRIAERLGIPVYVHQQLLPELGAREGKGEALWKSLLVTKGDLVAWIDTDIVNIHPRFVYGILGPLLLNPDIQLVKGFYRRPLRVGDKVQAGGGGRVTELAARPLLNLFYPELSGLIQPLSGEYAGRREALEKAVFFSTYGVETGLVIDVFERYGLGAIAQVDLLERIHRNQGLEALSKMSFVIVQTVLRKLEARYERAIVEDVNKTMKLIRHSDAGYFLDVEEVIERERPPMITVPAYRELHGK